MSPEDILSAINPRRVQEKIEFDVTNTALHFRKSKSESLQSIYQACIDLQPVAGDYLEGDIIVPKGCSLRYTVMAHTSGGMQAVSRNGEVFRIPASTPVEEAYEEVPFKEVSEAKRFWVDGEEYRKFDANTAFNTRLERVEFDPEAKVRY